MLLPSSKQEEKEPVLKIEDFFDESVLGTKLGKKSFSSENGTGHDSNIHYSKHFLAERYKR